MALVLTILPGAGARAADGCVAAPNSQAPNGRHWWYRTDRVTKRKCWFLGPQDKTALKGARQARPAAPTPRPAAETTGPAPQSPSTQSSLPVPVGHAGGGEVQPFEQAAARGIPFLVLRSDLPQAAGIIGREEAASTEWAMEERAIQEPATTGAGPGEDEAQPPQTVAGQSDTTDGATLVQMLSIFIAALLIAGGLCQAVLGIARGRLRRLIGARPSGARPVHTSARLRYSRR
jgi:hypothetical protein